MTSQEIFDALHATWPAQKSWEDGAWTHRESSGGGNRVNASTRLEDSSEVPNSTLVMGRPRQPYLDQALEQARYRMRDATLALTMPVPEAPEAPPLVTTFLGWEPLEAHRMIWQQDGIGPERLAIMDRVASPKTALLGRINDRPAGAGFAACHNGIAMVHALSVLEANRRQGLAQRMMMRAMVWARAQEAHTLAVLVTKANKPAIALYERLGMRADSSYHYRVKGE